MADRVRLQLKVAVELYGQALELGDEAMIAALRDDIWWLQAWLVDLESVS
jgi:hypothetical protein